ncbi:Poly [ADP-ribose] polymerase 12 [Armadillidium vulgare]|nr:Poly [ADP-ribose] polymerase 12 [Armadillidium vulgare]
MNTPLNPCPLVSFTEDDGVSPDLVMSSEKTSAPQQSASSMNFKKNFNGGGRGGRGRGGGGFGSSRSYFSTSTLSSGDSNRFYDFQNERGSFRGSRSVFNIPSDSESVTSDNSDFSGEQPKFGLTAPALARRLSECDQLEATLLQLFDKFQFHYKHTKQIALRNSTTFEVDGEVVKLRPKVKLCSSHSDLDGCQNPETCDSIHICPKYVADNCKDVDCIFGHEWLTNHNKMVLLKFNLNFIPKQRLFFLFQTVILSSAADIELNVCEGYNLGDCTTEDCSYLHLCIKFLARCCSDGCSLNHTLSSQTKCILKSYGISLNESPRDIFIKLANMSSIKESLNTFLSRDESDENEEEYLDTSDDVNIQEDEKESSKKTKQESKDDDNHNGSSDEEEPVQEEEKEKEVPLKTMWSHDLMGDVKISEICYESVEGYCPYEESGCWRLHSTYHFYWQIKASLGKKDVWVNLTEEQVLALEKAFCDPCTSKVDVPILNPLAIRVSEKGLLIILKGRSKWEANFDTMKINLVGKSDTLDLRRVCTDKTAKETPEPCVFKWYFIDKHGKWIEYGNIDSTGEEKLKCNIDSDFIENEYVKNPLGTITFKSQAFSYILDLATMTQKNQGTNVVRAVRRRPQIHFKEKKVETDLPSNWEPMQPDERCRRVTLQPSSDEYKNIDNLVQTRARGNTYNILKIERVQNPYVYRAFQNKVQEMKVTYKNEATIDIQQLFHGTGPDIVPKICDENFDWRLHGSSTGQMYGRGTYFAMHSSYSISYAKQDANGHRFMFVAKVAVGTTTQGNSGITRPPINTQYNLPYDSTVDNVGYPAIIVKYDKQEYFPEYIITFG